MKQLLASHRGADGIDVPSPFRDLLDDGFNEVEGCVFFRRFFRADKIDPNNTHQDQTGYEASINRIHLEDYLDRGMAREALRWRSSP